MVAPLEESDHAEFESADIRQPNGETSLRGVAAVWQMEHSASALLEFVESQPRTPRPSTPAWSPPTSDQSHSSDSMMRLTDPALQDLVDSSEFLVGQHLPLPSLEADNLDS
jgi:hypothetical protein